MNKLVLLTILLIASSLCFANASKNPEEDPELDPIEVEEPGCPKIHNLTPITHFKDVSWCLRKIHSQTSLFY